MKKIQFTLVFALFLSICLPTSLKAQEISIDKVMGFQLRNAGSILNGNQIEGYYFFYEVDRVNRKTRAYLLKIFDANLKEVSSKLIEESKYFSLMEGGFNGATLMLEFYNAKEKHFVLRQYDRDAEQISETVSAINPKYSPILLQGDDSEFRADFLFSIPYQGFVNVRPVKFKKMGYEVQFISIDRTNKGWTYQSPSTSRLFETTTFMDGNSELAAFMVTKRPSIMSQKVSFFLQALNLATGKELFSTPLLDNSHALYPLKGNVDPETGNIMVLGQYYKPNANPMKDKSQGLFSFLFDPKGTIIKKSFVSWTKDVSKFVPINEKGKIADVGFIYFHYMTKLSNGKIYAIGEQYRKAVSAGGVALKMLDAASRNVSSNISAFKIVTEDIMIFQFSEDFVLEDIEIIDKSKTNVNLPGGYGNFGVVRLGYILDIFGEFDYSFTQMAKQEDGFIIGYVDYEKLKKEKNRTVFGGIVLNEGEFSVDKIPVNNKGNRLIVMPAKPGFVMIAEYDKKSKSITMRLEKINY